MVALMTTETFGERLRRLRTQRGLSPGELGLKVGVTEGAIRQMESGQTKSASFAVGVRLAHVLGVEPLYLAVGDESPIVASPLIDPVQSDRLQRVETAVAELLPLAEQGERLSAAVEAIADALRSRGIPVDMPTQVQKRR